MIISVEADLMDLAQNINNTFNKDHTDFTILLKDTIRIKKNSKVRVFRFQTDIEATFATPSLYLICNEFKNIYGITPTGDNLSGLLLAIPGNIRDRAINPNNVPPNPNPNPNIIDSNVRTMSLNLDSVFLNINNKEDLIVNSLSFKLMRASGSKVIADRIEQLSFMLEIIDSCPC